jgi:endonuclease III
LLRSLPQIGEKLPDNTIGITQQPLYVIAAMLRQMSKWVKNTFVLVNIFRHIELEWHGIPSQDFSDWPQFFEIGPKTGSLIFHAAFGKMMTLPVDLHVWYAFCKWGWTNAKSTDECSWQASQWIDPSYFISTNTPLDLSVKHWPMSDIAK